MPTGTRGYMAPTREARAELREKGSRFLAIVSPVETRAAAREVLSTLTERYADATHVCWAWRVGEPAEERRSDAGEPSGTAGMPMLQVLRGKSISDVSAVVVRWYGGTKLGKGGLARAYSGAVSMALDQVELEERQPSIRVRVRLPYTCVGEMKRLLHPPEVVLLAESYGEDVEVTLKVFRSLINELRESLGALGGTVEELGA